MVCYNNIILVHHKVRKLWYNSYVHTMGPQVDIILCKSLAIFPKLDPLGVEDMGNFYDHLQKVSMNYALALMPFNAVVLSNRFEGLCSPGLGLLCYAAMCKALMELLPWLIPGSVSPQVNAALASVRYETGNGYNYLGACLSSRLLDLTPQYQSRPRCGPKSRTFSSLLRTTYYSSVYRPSSTSIMMTALDLVYSCMSCSPYNLPTLSPSYNCTSTCTNRS